MIKPIIKNNICLNFNPSGCEREVQRQIDYVLNQKRITGPHTALIIGSSMGYGLAARIVAAFSLKMNTVGVAYERPSGLRRQGSIGWHNTAYLEQQARARNVKAATVFGDAYSSETKAETARLLKKEYGRVDLIVYSLASGARKDPATGVIHRGVIKPIGRALPVKTVNLQTRRIVDAGLEPATGEEIAHTVKVMGGEDWRLWIEALLAEDLLAPGAITVAFSYIGPVLTSPIYRDGTLGRAKLHLESTAHELDRLLKAAGGRAFVSVNKALVTRSSSVIPLVPLYISILYKVMKEKGIHEGCIEQMFRLFRDRLYADTVRVDREGRIRLDDNELREDVQAGVKRLWRRLETGDINEIADLDGFVQEFLAIHGFTATPPSSLGLAG
jgi:enoyl-[acyl-carrier protein] reductase/trans-2-enoyl-CoA reductase (NAD+)